MSGEVLKRICNICNEIIVYKSKRGYTTANNKGSLCSKCGAKKCYENNKEKYKNNFIDKQSGYTELELTRKCPSCNINLKYSCMSSLVNAVDKNILCRKCSKAVTNKDMPKDTTRECPSCLEIITHKTRQSMLQAKRNGAKCRNCSYESKFKRNCPTCNVELRYGSLDLYEKATEDDWPCNDCTKNFRQSKYRKKQ